MAVFLEDGVPVARQQGVDVELDELAHPDAAARIRAALANRNAGDVLVSAAPGYEFRDLGGGHHAGGASHGSLAASDSEVPVVSVGLGPQPRSILDLAPLALERLGVPLTAGNGAAARAA